MSAFDELNETQGVYGSIIVELPNKVLRTTFDDMQTTQYLKIILPLIQNSIKLVPKLRIGQIRAMKREIVYAIEDNNIVISFLNMAKKQ